MDRRPYGGMSSSRDDRSRKRARSRSRSRPRSRRRRERSRSRSRGREPPRSRPEDATGGWGAPPPGWGQPPQAQTGWGAPPVAQGSTQGGWAASAPLAPVVARPAAPKKKAEDVLREWVLDGKKCCNEADSMCPLSRRFRGGTLLRAEAVGDEPGREAMIEADCKAKDLKTVHSLYCHCRSKKQSGCHYHAVVLFARGVDYLREALAERVALRTPPLPGSPWDVLPDDIGKMIGDDFPHLWRARQEEFGRGGRSGTAPAIPRSQFVANESAAAAARGKAAREREKTKEATARAEKTRQDLLKSQLALFNSQEETAAANERIAGLEDQLRRERRESERSAHLKRSEELGRRSVEARAREAEARARAADRNKSEAERERDRLRADLDKLKAADDERRALEAKTRAEATTLLGEVEADDDDAFHRSVRAFRSAVDHGLDALGAKDKQSVWDEIYRPIDVHRDTLVEDVTARLEPAASKERTATGAVKEWTKEQMERRPVRVTFKDRGAATQRSGKSKGAGKEAGIDDGGLTNEMYAKYFDQLLMLRPDLFASTGAIGARALPTKDATWTALPDAARIEKDFERVGRVMCRAVHDGRPIPKALASTIVVRFFQGVEPAALNASGAMVRGPFSKTALLEELLLIDDPGISGICEYIVGEDDMSEMFDTVGTALCWSKNGQWSAADPDAQILELPWSNEPADRILVFERLVQREIIEPRRKALEAMRRGFRTVEMVPQLTRALFPSSRQLSRFICGDDKLDADKLWSLFTFDPEAYSQLAIESEQYSEGIYTEDEPTMRHLRDVLSEFCDADRLKFFKFVTGLTAIPVTRPGAAKPFQLLIDGKGWDTDRLPQASACYYQLHCPPYPTKDVLMKKLRMAIHETEGFDQK